MKRFVETLKVAGIVVGSLLAIWGLWDKVATLWRDDLVAEVRYGAWRIPPQFASRLNSLRVAVSDSVLLGNRNDRPQRLPDLAAGIAKRALVGKAQDAVRTEMEWGLSRELGEIAGYWEVTVRNVSSHRLSHVTLVLPNATIATVGRDGVPQRDTSTAGVIGLSDMQAQEAINVFAWSTRTPDTWDLRDIRITHDAGVGSVRAFVPVGRVGQMAETVLGIPALMLALWIVSTMLVVVLRLWTPAMKPTATRVDTEAETHAGGA